MTAHAATQLTVHSRDATRLDPWINDDLVNGSLMNVKLRSLLNLVDVTISHPDNPVAGCEHFVVMRCCDYRHIPLCF